MLYNRRTVREMKIISVCKRTTIEENNSERTVQHLLQSTSKDDKDCDKENEVVYVDYATLNDSAQQVALEISSNVYVAGYLCYKIRKEFNCTECKIDLLKDKNEVVKRQELHVLYKDYGITDEINILLITKSELCHIINLTLHLTIYLKRKMR